MKQSRVDAVFSAANLTIIIILTLLITYPLYYTVIASFSGASAIALGQVTLWPVDFSVLAYKNVINNSNFWIGYRNTIFYTVFGTLYNLALTIPCAYVMSKKYLPLRKTLTWFFFITMYFGGGLIPSYMWTRTLGLINTPWVMIVGSGVSCYNMIVTRQFFSSTIPDEMYEAAEIDGASHLHQFLRIAMPLATPIIAVMALYYGVGHWNAYFGAMIYITDHNLYPLQLVLRSILIMNEQTLQAAIELGDEELINVAMERSRMAQVMKYSLIFISSAPLLVAYPFIQKYFVKGVMIGSLKG